MNETITPPRPLNGSMDRRTYLATVAAVGGALASRHDDGGEDSARPRPYGSGAYGSGAYGAGDR